MRMTSTPSRESSSSVRQPHGRTRPASTPGSNPRAEAGRNTSRDETRVDYSFTSSTVFFTESKDVLIAFFSSSLSWISWIFSTPPAPMVTGTPKK